MPGSDLPSNDLFELIYFDKWVHIGLFCILTILWAYPFLKLKLQSVKAFILIALIAIVYGIAMEFVQKYFANGRSFDITDIIADAVGASLAAFLLIKIYRRSAGL